MERRGEIGVRGCHVRALIDHGLVHFGGSVGFVPDSLLGDDPEAVKDGLRTAVARLVEQERFSHLLFAHGEPVVGEGRAALERFLA